MCVDPYKCIRICCCSELTCEKASYKHLSHRSTQAVLQTQCEHQVAQYHKMPLVKIVWQISQALIMDCSHFECYHMIGVIIRWPLAVVIMTRWTVTIGDAIDEWQSQCLWKGRAFCFKTIIIVVTLMSSYFKTNHNLSLNLTKFYVFEPYPATLNISYCNQEYKGMVDDNSLLRTLGVITIEAGATDKLVFKWGKKKVYKEFSACCILETLSSHRTWWQVYFSAAQYLVQSQ